MWTSCPQACIASPVALKGAPVRSTIGSPSSSARTATGGRRLGPRHRLRRRRLWTAGRVDRGDQPSAGDRRARHRQLPRDRRGGPPLGVRELRPRVQSVAQLDRARQLALDARQQRPQQQAGRVSPAAGEAKPPSVDRGIAPAHLADIEVRDRGKLGALDADVGVVQQRRHPSAHSAIVGERPQRGVQRRRQRTDAEALARPRRPARRGRGRGSAAPAAGRAPRRGPRGRSPQARDRGSRSHRPRGTPGAAAPPGRRRPARRAAGCAAALRGCAPPGRPRRRSSGAVSGARPTPGSARSARSARPRGAGSPRRSARRARSDMRAARRRRAAARRPRRAG